MTAMSYPWFIVTTEEVQDNSDSGVEVNSVSSCDSAINSPKIPEFNLKEAVNFLSKGNQYLFTYIFIPIPAVVLGVIALFALYILVQYLP